MRITPMPTAERGERMRYVVSRMTLTDIPRVVEIEKLAYTTPWPSSAYRKELQDNQHAYYIVVRDTLLDAPASQVEPTESQRRPFPLSLLPNRPVTTPSVSTSSIVGFAGLWLMIDEAHVTTIANHPDYRGRGIGELMLSSLIDISYEIGARAVSLEVRVSNYVAQNLYRKYGFKEAGIRRRYYSDNHEDAMIMWTDDINGLSYREQFGELKAALQRRMQEQESRSSLAGHPNAGER